MAIENQAVEYMDNVLKRGSKKSGVLLVHCFCSEYPDQLQRLCTGLFQAGTKNRLLVLSKRFERDAPALISAQTIWGLWRSFTTRNEVE